MSDDSSSRGLVAGASMQTVHSHDEINLLEYIYAIVKKKWWIIGMTVFGIAGGYITAIVKGPTWVAEAVIAPKEAESQKAPNLTSLGAFGGLVASQLNIGGNASIGKMLTLLDSRDFNARLIENYHLLPDLIRYKRPKTYAQQWDSVANDWRKEFHKPDSLGMGEFLKSKFLKTTDKDNLLTLRVHSRDSTLSHNLAGRYIEFLNDDIKRSVKEEAGDNVEYLERQLVGIADPLLREKIQSMIADEIEKTMVISKEAFKIIDPIYISESFKEKKLYPIVFGFASFFTIVVVIFIAHALSSSQKSDSDRALILQIKKSLLSLK